MFARRQDGGTMAPGHVGPEVNCHIRGNDMGCLRLLLSAAIARVFTDSRGYRCGPMIRPFVAKITPEVNHAFHYSLL
jgi:hypothetical protein